MNENLNENQNQSDISSNAAHIAGKKAATYFGGGVGAAAYDVASQTKVGQAIENAAGKALQQNHSINMAKRHSTDQVPNNDESLDENKVDDSLNNNNELQQNENQLNQNNSITNSSNEELDLSNLNQGNGLLPFNGNNKFKFAIIGGLCAFFISIFLVVISAASKLQPFYNAANYVQGIWFGIVDFFTQDQQELEENYYKKLSEIQKKINRENKVCIDINLISAALTAYTDFSDMLDMDVEDAENSTDYKKMIDYVELLARMQIITRKYIPVLKVENDGTDNLYVKITEGIFDSSTVEKVSRNDYYGDDFAEDIFNGLINGSYQITVPTTFNFFEKETKHENNYEFYNYSIFKMITSSEQLKSDEYVLSIGSYETREDSVYYWNLINSFIPEYYKNYLPNDKEEKDRKIKEIADEIYLLYSELGPGPSCENSNGVGTYAYNYLIDGMRYNNVMVNVQNCSGTQILASNLSLEEYVLGVLYGEVYSNWNIGALKTTAVAVRTYTLANRSDSYSENGNLVINARSCSAHYQNYCDPINGCHFSYIDDNEQHESGIPDSAYMTCAPGVDPSASNNKPSIENTIAYQNFSNAVTSTAGQVLINDASNIVSPGYRSDDQLAWKEMADSGMTYDVILGSYNQFGRDYASLKLTSPAIMVSGSDSSCMFKQYDKSWKNDTLGHSGATLEYYGCYLTSIAMLICDSGTVDNSIFEFQNGFNPGTYNLYLTNRSSFAASGGLNTPRTKEISRLGDIQSISVFGKGKDYIVKKVNELLLSGNKVMVRVKSNSGACQNIKNGYKEHWVAVVSTTDNNIIVKDPSSELNETELIDRRYNWNCFETIRYFPVN